MPDRDIRVELDIEAAAAERTLDDLGESAEDTGKQLDKLSDVKVTTDTSDAEQGLQDITDAAEDLAKLKVEVGLEADGSTAERIIAEVQAKVDALDGSTPKVDLSVDAGTAESDLAEVADKVDELDGRKATIRVEVDEDSVRKVKSDVDDVKTKADNAKTSSVSAVRDITGPLGEASSNVGDFGDSFVALGETIGTQMGLSETAIGNLAAFLGPAGIAVGAVVTFWNIFQSNAKKAREETEKLLQAQEQLAAGEFKPAITEVTKDLGPLANLFDRLGVSIEDVTKFITGQADAIPGLRTEFKIASDVTDEAARVSDKLNISYEEALKLVGSYSKKIPDLRNEWLKTNGTLEESQQLQFEVAKGLGASSQALLDQAKNALPSVRQQIVLYVAEVNKIPPSKVTEILTDADPDDIKQVNAELDAIANKKRTAVITPVIDFSKLSADIQKAVNAAAAFNPIVVPASSTTTTTTAARTQERRNGTGTVVPRTGRLAPR